MDVNEELKFLGKLKKKLDVNEELKFLGKLKKKLGEGVRGGGGGGRFGGSGLM